MYPETDGLNRTETSGQNESEKKTGLTFAEPSCSIEKTSELNLPPQLISKMTLKIIGYWLAYYKTY